MVPVSLQQNAQYDLATSICLLWPKEGSLRELEVGQVSCNLLTGTSKEELPVSKAFKVFSPRDKAQAYTDCRANNFCD